MKQLKLIMLFCIGALFIASKSFGQANPFINVLPSNSGIVSVGDTIDIIVTIGNTGPVSAVPQAKLRPIIQVPSSVTFLPIAQQTGLPAGWTILSNTGSQLRVCNSADPIPVNTSRTIILKAQGVTVSPAQTFSGNINFGNGTTCAAGPTVNGDLITDNSALSTIQVVAPVTLNLNVFIEAYFDGIIGEMHTPLYDNGMSSNLNDCDSLTVELHSTTSGLYEPIVAYSSTKILKKDGTITCTFSGAALGNSYYIVLKHRNALQTWSANPVTMTSTTNYDFTSLAANTFGSNVAVLSNGKFAMLSGDINQDFSIDNIDYPDWENDYLNFAYGYNITDLNGDLSTDNLDYPYWETNYLNFVFAAAP